MAMPDEGPAPAMQVVQDGEQLQDILRSNPAVLVLYGAPTCGVCTAIKPRLLDLLRQRFTQLVPVYVDCAASPELSAQEGIFTLPVVRVYFEGQRFVQRVRVFGLQDLAEDIQRPYDLISAP